MDQAGERAAAAAARGAVAAGMLWIAGVARVGYALAVGRDSNQIVDRRVARQEKW